MFNYLILNGYLFFVSFAATYILTPFAIYFAVKFKVVDQPGFRKLHENPTPLFGGTAIFLSFTIVAVIHMLLALRLKLNPSHLSPDSFLYSQIVDFNPDYLRLLIIFGGGLFILLIGLLDDLLDLPVPFRLAIEFIIATVVVLSGLKPEIPLGSPFTEIIAVVWIVGVTNAFNLLDGADGLSCGTAVICSLGLSLCLIMQWTFQPMVSALLASFAGACFGFLPYNFPRARAFLGSAGSMFIGYMLGVSVLLSSLMNFESLGIRVFSIPLFVLAVPLYDTLSVILIRLKNGKNILKGDFNHFVHRLIRKGLSPRKSVTIIYLISVFTLCNAFFLINIKPSSTVIILQVLLCIVILIAVEKVASVKLGNYEKIS
ncbi:MAG: undecaprenyl/decaprenyl-phosphate alpha-N-acetylglucosaminyl 1-phosphate transferase [Planctomycetes bacterium]|nr:undecaprenyl/decaprenyl-phosphate alpha-N-acetylglucosaminyl 1-phosphate transferase [Planctomycetota bacterium]